MDTNENMNFKSQIANFKQSPNAKVSKFEIWKLEFVCDLVLVFCYLI
jgi:hypothetical protein